MLTQLKPSSNSFKDRIAAFNKPAAPPIAPFKPSGLGSGSSGFIKKPFVAPPPSRHAYVPPPRDAPAAKVYRREEDPEITGVRRDSGDNTEKATPISTLPGNSELQNEDQPKPTSLKERIALLQKQQAEAAQAAAKKEKPVRPPKKRLESNGQQDISTAQITEGPPPLGRKDSVDVASKKSMDESHSARQSFNISRAPTGSIENNETSGDRPEAGDITESQADRTGHEDDVGKPIPVSHETPAPVEQATGEEEEEEEDDEVDPEVRRKEELRARMAKMSGGMGMAGMFGPPGMMGMPVKKPKPSIPVERRPSGLSEGPSSPRAAAPPVPTMMALPGMALPGMAKPKEPREPEEVLEPEPKQEPPEESAPAISVNDTVSPEPEESRSTAPPPVPEARPAPPPIPTESRPPPPPPPPAAVVSPSDGSESDDELSEHTSKPLETSKAETSPTSRGPPPIPMASPPLPTSPRFSNDSRHEEMSPVSPGFSPQQNKRNSRPPPPIPDAAPPAPTHTRPPPPLPPAGALSRASTGDDLTGLAIKPSRQDNDDEGEGTEYEGDYDTDIPPSVHHKDALKAPTTEPSFDDNSSLRSPVTEYPPTVPPPIPSNSAPRAGPPPVPTPLAPAFRTSTDIPRGIPPPIPSQPAPRSRVSIDSPRAAPPPPPPPKAAAYNFDDDEYDPYNYNSAQSPPISSHERPPSPPPPPSSTTDRRAPPSTPTSSRAPPRKSTDILRPSVGKRSMDATRHSISLETGFMANEIDLSTHTQWWLSRNGVPPAFQGRKDVYTETSESNSTENGRNFVTKEISILFQDYSQTIIAVRFDPQNPSQTELDQRHEPPPRALRQDELEEAYERFGRRVAQSVTSKKDSVVGDGTPHALVHELLRPLNEVLLPVGTRAYGALVYANLANAATQLNDEIRPGDIISIRNAKFQGKHGPMHAKYTTEVGKPDHVAIVAEWDGTKKKVRAWEQGRENKKVKQESYKLEDLRSGEVKIWRLMPRTWVGWSSKD
ncbi:hypothetical protein NPX13_g5729 [Xylaria arbuscula]|uniref:BBC1/AIM3 cysteine proteinase-fold domain-containing protein n=1 Tax=Xylaria arbuscula TaxID=114810 RepID=A0A9W8NEA1_9PEZI|nr:hypothetical protein NPX13_g5729 [Xylaria arbuscula]